MSDNPYQSPETYESNHWPWWMWGGLISFFILIFPVNIIRIVIDVVWDVFMD